MSETDQDNPHPGQAEHGSSIGNEGGHGSRETGAAPRRPVPNSHARLTGQLRAARRGALLETEDGTLWRIVTEDVLDPYFGERVVVEGRVGDQDDLALLWIGNAPDQSEAA